MVQAGVLVIIVILCCKALSAERHLAIPEFIEQMSKQFLPFCIAHYWNE
jgi:hypothetical protein